MCYGADIEDRKIETYEGMCCRGRLLGFDGWRVEEETGFL
jgi:hypothetical protein